MNHEKIVRALDHLFKAEHEIKCASDDSSNLSEFAVEIADLNRRLRGVAARDSLSTPSTNQSEIYLCRRCGKDPAMSKNSDGCVCARY